MKGVNDVTSSRPYANEARHLDVLMYISSLLAGQITYVRANTYVSGATRHPYTWPTFIPSRVVSSLDRLVCLTLLAPLTTSCFIVVELGVIIIIVFHCRGILRNNYRVISLL